MSGGGGLGLRGDMEVENRPPESAYAREARATELLYQTLARKAPRHGSPTPPSFSSSSSSRRFSKRLGVAELSAFAERIATADSAGHKGDEASYVRLLASRKFNSAKLADKIGSLESTICNRPYARSKLEGSNIEGYIAHNHDMVVSDTINKAKMRVELDIEVSQRTRWSWRQLMGPKMGASGGGSSGVAGAILAGGGGGGGGGWSATSAAAAARILPIVSYPESTVNGGVAGASGGSKFSSPINTMAIVPIAASGGSVDLYDLLENCVDEFVHYDSPRGQVVAAMPFTKMQQMARNFSSFDPEEQEAMTQYHVTLELLALMTEKAPREGEKWPRWDAAGSFFPLAFGVADPIDPSDIAEISRNRLTDGALAFLGNNYTDDVFDNPNGYSSSNFASIPSSAYFRLVYLLLRRGELEAAANLLSSGYPRISTKVSSGFYGMDPMEVTSRAGYFVSYLLQIQRPLPSKASGDVLRPAHEYMLRFLKEYDDFKRVPSNGHLCDVYLEAVLKLLVTLWSSVADDEQCATEMPGNALCPTGLPATSTPSGAADLEAFLWTKLWWTRLKRFIRDDLECQKSGGDCQKCRAPRPPGHDIVPEYLRHKPDVDFRVKGAGGHNKGAHLSDCTAAPVDAGENLLYADVQEDGGAPSFEASYQGSPHHYVRTLICCHRYGEAVSYLASRACVHERHYTEAVHLCWALLYHGLLSSHTPLLLNPRAGLPPRCEVLDAHEQVRPVDLLVEYVKCSLHVLANKVTADCAMVAGGSVVSVIPTAANSIQKIQVGSVVTGLGIDYSMVVTVVSVDDAMDSVTLSAPALSSVTTTLMFALANSATPIDQGQLVAVADMLTLLMPPRRAQIELATLRASLPQALPTASKEYSKTKRQAEAISEAISGAHAAHADALEELLLHVVDNFGENAVLFLLSQLRRRDPMRFDHTLEGLVRRVGTRALHVNHSLEASRFFFQHANAKLWTLLGSARGGGGGGGGAGFVSPAEIGATQTEGMAILYREVSTQLAATLIPESSAEAVARQQRDFWQFAADELLSLGASPPSAPDQGLPPQHLRHLLNLTLLRQAVDLHYNSGDEADVFSVLDKLELGREPAPASASASASASAPGQHLLWQGQGQGQGPTAYPPHLPRTLTDYGKVDRVAVDHFFSSLDRRVWLLYDFYFQKKVEMLRCK